MFFNDTKAEVHGIWVFNASHLHALDILYAVHGFYAWQPALQTQVADVRGLRCCIDAVKS